ncbi:MAG: redoxin domain-containing protein [Planctomycetaceae bacterium]|nr:redoxin domain-containing protein [Planctomycetaceae bacterium]
MLDLNHDGLSVRADRRRTFAGLMRLTAFLTHSLVIFSLVTFSLVTSSQIAEADEPASDQFLFRFSGTLLQGRGDGDIIRRFESSLLNSAENSFFHVLDDAGAGCGWPESFGRLNTGSESSGPVPHIVYNYDGHDYSISLPFLHVQLPNDAGIGTSWEIDGWKLTILEPRREAGQDCWFIEASEKRGRKQSLLVDRSTGVLWQAEADVFMGRGDRFLLKIRQTRQTTLPQEIAARTRNVMELLLQLQKNLGRRPDTQLKQLSPRQADLTAQVQPTLHQLSEGTPLQELVLRLTSSLKSEKTRIAASTMRAGEILNSRAPDFSLNVVSGGTLDSQDLQGRIVILHFWDYKDQPLAEPYGQTGYLDFLFNQRKKLGVQVVGVAVGADLQTADGVSRGKRAARKLAEFMNITYPIGYDDGSLLRALGDPRDANGNLPLWIVIGRDGTIAHYHAGFYEVDATRGLSELDAVVSRQIKTPSQQ